MATKSLADLQREIADQQKTLKSLEQKREKLANQIKDIDAQISAIRGTGGTRFRNEKALHEHIRDVLSKTKKGLPLREISKRVKTAGYKSGAANFNNTVYQTLYKQKEFVRDSKSGNWTVKG